MINYKNKMIKILQNQLNLNIKKYIIIKIKVIKKLNKMIKIITIFSRKKKIIKKKTLIKI